MTSITPITGIPVAPTETACRLCGGKTVFAFRKIMIGKFSVSFYRCENCGSQQSEDPYWLAEAYSDQVLSIDPGAAQRVLDCLALTHVVARLFGYRRMLDYGGGSGLLCRLLRDAGHDAYWYDGYTTAGYATGFEGSPKDHFDLVTAIEVVEHFPEPKKDFDALFGASPDALLIMTCLFEGQDENWWYIAPEEGQHIFFYSPKAIDMLAARYGYRALVCTGFIIFLKVAPTKLQKAILQKILTPKIVSLIRLLVIARRTSAPQADSALLEERVRQKQRILPT